MRCAILLHLEWEDEIITVTAQLSNRWGQVDLVNVHAEIIYTCTQSSHVHGYRVTRLTYKQRIKQRPVGMGMVRDNSICRRICE